MATEQTTNKVADGPNTARRVTAKEANTRLAYRRLSVLQLAQSLGSVLEACLRGDMDLSRFYEYRRRFQTYGLEGLKDKLPIHKSQPQSHRGK